MKARKFVKSQYNHLNRFSIIVKWSFASRNFVAVALMHGSRELSLRNFVARRLREITLESNVHRCALHV